VCQRCTTENAADAAECELCLGARP
jgi:hypothetical protein